jgi:hypothetical protein
VRLRKYALAPRIWRAFLDSKPFQRVAGKRLIYRSIANCAAVHSVGIARAVKGDLTPASDKFCRCLRKVAAGL